MADTGIFATTQEVKDMVGANANTTANDEPFINRYMKQAEAMINSTITFNFSDDYSGLNDDIKKLLSIAAASLVAQWVIAYEPDAPGRGSSTIKLNVLENTYQQAIRELKEKDTQEFIKNG